MTETDAAPFVTRMKEAGLPDIAIRNFLHYYEALGAGESGLIPEADIEPVGGLPDAEALDPALADLGRAALGRTVVIKLNGGLGTSMGMQKAKSLLPVKAGRTFLHIIASACAHQGVPLVLMNSFATHADSLAALEQAPTAPGGGGAGARNLPTDFLQHKIPKVHHADLTPAHWPDNPDLAWCPPGHGDLYPALVSSGALDALQAAGMDYAFVSNADNLGAVVDPAILGYLVSRNVPFLMEVADRTVADRKGGHLARRRSDDHLLLRERAQCPEAELSAFEDVAAHRYFNTNSLWLHLPTVQRLLDERDGVLGLPLIVNHKPLDPRDPSTPRVVQLETAMGAAIAAIPGAEALRVPRTRFAPVKTTSDLLAVRSDAYLLTEDHRVIPNPARDPALPVLDVRLDPRFYRLIDALEARFPQGPPSLIECAELEIVGDVRFGRDVTCRGRVAIRNEESAPLHIADGTVLEG